MVKVLVYTLSYNNEKDAKDWIQRNNDADLFFVADLCSTDNTIDVLSEDPRVYCQIPGASFSHSRIEVLNFASKAASNIAKSWSLKYGSSSDEWVLLYLDFNDSIESDGIQKIKNSWDSTKYTQISFRQENISTEEILHTSDISTVIRACSANDNFSWNFSNGSFQLIKGNDIWDSNIRILHRDTFYREYILRNFSEILNYIGSIPKIGDLAYFRKLIHVCMENTDTKVFDKIFLPCFHYYEDVKSRVFSKELLGYLFLTYIKLLFVGFSFYPEYKECDLMHLCAEMKRLSSRFDEDDIFKFKILPYMTALYLIEYKDIAANRNDIRQYLNMALITPSNLYFSNEFADTQNSKNSEIQDLIDKYSK